MGRHRERHTARLSLQERFRILMATGLGGNSALLHEANRAEKAEPFTPFSSQGPDIQKQETGSIELMETG